MKAQKVDVLSRLNMTYIGRGFYRVDSPFIFRVLFDDGHYQTFEVPVGFITDLHSIPLLVRVFVRFMRKDTTGMNQSAAGHDYLYRFHSLLKVTQRQADDIYLLLCFAETANLPEIERVLKRSDAKLRYTALRRFGWTAWGRGDGTPPRCVRKMMKQLGL